MSDRPENVPQKVWDEAVRISGFGGGHEMKAYVHSVRVEASRALLKAREDALEEAAKIVEGFSPIRPAFVTEDEGGQKWPHPAQQMPIYDPEKLASAIRQHSQKGER